jgi:D-tyrosyl-tRNA(Tyr) deacylase
VIAVVQRVTGAQIAVGGEVVGRIDGGLVALVAVHAADTATDVTWTAGKLVGLRIFRQGDKHFELDVKQAGGSVLLVSNFTVAARTRQGRRPSFEAAARPEKGRQLFDALAEAVRAQGVAVETGVFGADMAVSLVNDGPVTVIIDSTGGRRDPA